MVPPAAKAERREEAPMALFQLLPLPVPEAVCLMNFWACAVLPRAIMMTTNKRSIFPCLGRLRNEVMQWFKRSELRKDSFCFNR